MLTPRPHLPDVPSPPPPRRLVARLLCKKVAPKLLPAIYEWAEKFLETGRACGAFCHGSDTVNST